MERDASPAAALNRTLGGTIAGDLLSDLGRRLYLPPGLVVQANEARRLARRYNATIGMATSRGEPLHLPSIRAQVPGLSPTEIFAYSPPAGLEELRRLWRDQLLEKNRDLDVNGMSYPVVMPGLTLALSTAADLFIDEDDAVIIPELYWENYSLIFSVRRKARMLTYPLLDRSQRLNTRAVEDLLAEEEKKADASSGTPKVILLLNFPNNPTGYSPDPEEVTDLLAVLGGFCRKGMRILAITDDAYFGLFYEKGIYEQSLFAPLSALSKNLLAVKVDGPTKEDLVWGFRVGFITLGSAGLKPEHYDALENKITGEIRSLVSNSSRLSQSLLIRALKGGSYGREKRRVFGILKERYRAVKRILASRGSTAGVKVHPFNSGYFMTLELENTSAPELRRRLLEQREIGTISIGERFLRIAYSSVDADRIEGFFEELFAVLDGR